jgi:hypothetical protein
MRTLPPTFLHRRSVQPHATQPPQRLSMLCGTGRPHRPWLFSFLEWHPAYSASWISPDIATRPPGPHRTGRS